MHDERWSHSDQWLEEFEKAFVHDTRDWIRQLTIAPDIDALAIRGSVKSFYAVQLAIQAIQTYCGRRTPFAATHLSLVVAGYPLELKFVHSHATQVAKRLSPQMRARRSELTAV